MILMLVWCDDGCRTGGIQVKMPLYSKVADDLRQQILTGELFDRIPPEITLASSFQVSVPTVKRALGILEGEDVIVRIRGKGTFVRSEVKKVPQTTGGTEQLRVQMKEELKEQLKEELKEELKEQFAHEQPQQQSQEQPVAEISRRVEPRSIAVGVILPKARDGFSRRLLSGIIEGLSENGARALVDFSNNDREREGEIIAGLLQAGVDGLIIFPMDGEIYNKDLLRLSLERFPVVFVDRWLPGIDISRVVSQHANGVKEAVDALYAAGHRNMALVFTGEFSASTESVIERTKGFREGLGANGISPTDDTVWIPAFKADGTFQDAEDYLVNKLRQHPDVTALVGVSSRDVRMAAKAARVVGRSIPNDLSIVGFDIGVEFSGIGELFGNRAEDFPVAWIDQSEFVIGREAAGVVSRLIAGSDKTGVIEVPTTFHWGRTCATVSVSEEGGVHMIAMAGETKK